MAFEDLSAYVSPGIDLPIAGRTYHVPAPNARDGLWLQGLWDGSQSVALTGSIGAANKVVLNDEQERNVYQLALGPAFDEMLADDVPWPIVKHAGMTAWVAWVRDRESAERHWARLKQDGQGNPGGEPPETAGSPTDGSPADPSTPPPA